LTTTAFLATIVAVTNPVAVRGGYDVARRRQRESSSDSFCCLLSLDAGNRVCRLPIEWRLHTG